MVRFQGKGLENPSEIECKDSLQYLFFELILWPTLIFSWWLHQANWIKHDSIPFFFNWGSRSELNELLSNMSYNYLKISRTNFGARRMSSFLIGDPWSISIIFGEGDKRKLCWVPSKCINILLLLQFFHFHASIISFRWKRKHHFIIFLCHHHFLFSQLHLFHFLRHLLP